MHDEELVATESGEVARRVREELARRRISRQALADLAKVSLSTLEKALAGTRPFTLATTLRIEAALGIALRPAAPRPTRDTAPDALGGYSRSSVRWLEGRYLTLRPSFGTPGAIYAYLTTIAWRDADGHLAFAESERLDARFQQTGRVSLATLSGHIYLVTDEQGQYRLQTLSRPTIEGTLYGVLATLQVGHGSQLVPVAAPIAMAKIDDPAACTFGLVAPGSPRHAAYRERLIASVGEDYVRFYLPA